jgi:hypothetical protein
LKPTTSFLCHIPDTAKFKSWGRKPMPGNKRYASICGTITGANRSGDDSEVEEFLIDTECVTPCGPFVPLANPAALASPSCECAGSTLFDNGDWRLIYSSWKIHCSLFIRTTTSISPPSSPAKESGRWLSCNLSCFMIHVLRSFEFYSRADCLLIFSILNFDVFGCSSDAEHAVLPLWSVLPVLMDILSLNSIILSWTLIIDVWEQGNVKVGGRILEVT